MRNVLTTFALLGVAACSANAASGASSSADDTTTSAPTLSTIKGREWARCWFDVVGANAQLSCTSTARGTDPLGATVEAFGSSTGNGDFKTFSQTLDIEKGGTVVVTSIPVTSFPVILSVTAKLAASAQQAIGLTNNTDFELALTVSAPGTVSSTTPAIIGENFDLWPAVVLDEGNVTGAIALSAKYEHTLAPYKDFIDAPSMELAPEVTFDKKVQYFVAPTTPALPMNATVGDKSFTTSLTGPGYFALTQDGLRAATADEISGGASTNPTTTPTPAPAPAVDPTPAPAPSVDPDPTCGGNNQNICQTAKKCDDGNVYNLNQQVCMTCGGNNQAPCDKSADNYDSSQGMKCNAGTVYSINQQVCMTCGADSQIPCYASTDNFDSSQGLKCNDGTAYSVNQQTCMACGASGQIACDVASNNADASQGLKCNDGLTQSFGDCQ